MSGTDEKLRPVADEASLSPAVENAAAAPPRRRWSSAEVWMLGIFSAIGLIGFIATFALVVMRSPGAPVQHTLTDAEIARLTGPRGEPGQPGPPGARGPAGDPGVRVLRVDCGTAGCAAECAPDEILLGAYCSPSRGPVAYPTEHSAACRPSGARVRVEVVAACVKSGRR
jgi:hypothetical protein